MVVDRLCFCLDVVNANVEIKVGGSQAKSAVEAMQMLDKDVSNAEAFSTINNNGRLKTPQTKKGLIPSWLPGI